MAQWGRSVRFYGIFGWLGVAWVMSACAENPSHLNTTYLDRYADPNPTLTSILECHGFSCSETSRASLNRFGAHHFRLDTSRLILLDSNLAAERRPGLILEIDIGQFLPGAVDHDLLIHKHFSSAPQDNAARQPHRPGPPFRFRQDPRRSI